MSARLIGIFAFAQSRFRRIADTEPKIACALLVVELGGGPFVADAGFAGPEKAGRTDERERIHRSGGSSGSLLDTDASTRNEPRLRMEQPRETRAARGR